MSVAKVVELVGTSKKGWQDAADNAIQEATRKLRKITGIDVISQTAEVVDGEIVEYRSTVNVAFLVDHRDSDQQPNHVPGTLPNFAETLDF